MPVAKQVGNDHLETEFLQVIFNSCVLNNTSCSVPSFPIPVCSSTDHDKGKYLAVEGETHVCSTALEP